MLSCQRVQHKEWGNSAVLQSDSHSSAPSLYDYQTEGWQTNNVRLCVLCVLVVGHFQRAKSLIQHTWFMTDSTVFTFHQHFSSSLSLNQS